MNFDVLVPNQPPVDDPGNVRLCVVGESPGVEECSWHVCASGHGFALEHWQNKQLVRRDRCPHCGSQRFEERLQPFCGESGRLLNDLLRASGLPRERCWVGNVSRRPLAEHEKTLDYVRPLLPRLAIDLEDFRPNCVLVLANLALAVFLGAGHSVTAYRGSIVMGELEGVHYKLVVACHPAAILREPSQLCLLRHDIARAVQEAATSAYSMPRRVVDAPSDPNEVIARLRALRAIRVPVGHDIEGGVETGVTVCSFADSPWHGLSIPFRRMDCSSVWSKPDADAILSAIKAILEDAAVIKVMHNASFEMFAWRWLHGIQVRNVHDSMIAFHVAWPELDKALDVVASIVTRQPYWGTTKDWRTDADRDLYNVIDSCVCLEAYQAVVREFTPAQAAYYAHSIALLEPCLAMMHDGLAYDAPARDAMVAQIQAEVWEAQGTLDSLAGIAPPSFKEVAEAVCFKNKLERVATWDDILQYSKPSFKGAL